MKLDDFKPTTVYTIYIAATPEKVWQALTSAEFSRKYFFGNAVEIEPGSAAPSSSARRMARCISAAKSSNAIRRANSRSHFNVNWPALIEKLGPTLVSYEIEPAGNAVGSP